MKLLEKNIAILVEDTYEDLELWYPVYRLREEGANVSLIGPQAGKVYHSKHGYPATSDLAADEVVARDYHAVIIPGGYAPDRMRRHPDMVRFATDALNEGKIVAAICHGGWLLCSTGGMQDRRVTSFFSIADDLTNAGAKWVDQEVVCDGNLITSRQPDDLPVFLQTIIESMAGTTIVA